MLDFSATAYWVMLLTKINTIVAVVEKRLKHLQWRPRELNMIIDIFGGKLLQGGLVFQQNFLIRSYELGPDGKVSLMALVNRLQVLNLVSLLSR